MDRTPLGCGAGPPPSPRLPILPPRFCARVAFSSDSSVSHGRARPGTSSVFFFFFFGVDGAAAPKPPAAAGFFFAETCTARRGDDVAASRPDAGINAASSATVRRACITAGVLWLSRAAQRLYFESQIDARAREMRQRLDSSETER